MGQGEVRHEAQEGGGARVPAVRATGTHRDETHMGWVSVEHGGAGCCDSNMCSPCDLMLARRTTCHAMPLHCSHHADVPRVISLLCPRRDRMTELRRAIREAQEEALEPGHVFPAAFATFRNRTSQVRRSAVGAGGASLCACFLDVCSSHATCMLCNSTASIHYMQG
jgi:hypothetical protein